MSPAKRFACMKARETQRVQTEVLSVCSSAKRQADWDNQSEFRAKPDSKVSSIDRMETSEEEWTDDQFDPDPPEPVSVAPSQPSLLDDPVLLNSPCVSIPRKQQAVFKHSKLLQHAAFPSKNVIYLKKWFLRKTDKGLFVDGINRESNIPWNSSIITDRVSNRVLKTVSGRVYNLVGKMNLDAVTEFPKWFLKGYAEGFPSNWKELYETYLSKGNLNRSKKTQNKSTKNTSMNLSAKRHRQSSSKTPESCPSSTVASTRVSRSGRLIKPPLKYRRGGRVVLDADMNATVHECYGTSGSLPVTATTEAAQTSAVVPLNKACEQQVPTANPQPSVRLRKVKTPLRKRDKTKTSTQEKLSSPPKTKESSMHVFEWWEEAGVPGENPRNHDKYVFQLQKRMKSVSVQCTKICSSKELEITYISQKTVRCRNTENDTFVVSEMFPDKDIAEADSDEEEDFYFSEND